MIRRVIFILFFTLVLIPFAPMAHAQVPAGNGDISVDLNPENPGPFQSVTITLTSYTYDLESSDIEWSVDGKAPVGGRGRSSYILTTKDTGTSTSVNVLITPVGSAPIAKSIVITPMAVDMLWEATDSIVPPLYRGKAMPTSESSVKFVAIPQVKSSTGTYLPSSDFIYDWEEDYNDDQNDSGYSKDSFTANMDYLNPTKNVSVNVSTPDGVISTAGTIAVTPVTPKLLWYASSPLYGPLFDSTLDGSYTVTGSDTSILAEPYFFSPADPSSPLLSYQWTLNGAAINTPSTPNALFLHRDTSTTGVATVDLSVTNLGKLFQEADNSLSLSLQ